MIIIPAIDLQNGQCVRLKQGDFEKSEVFSSHPIEQAKHWAGFNIQRLHLIDLDGAKEGHPIHQKVIENIVRQLPGVEIQVGGGIRHQATIEAYINSGAHYVIIGTQAIKSPSFLREMCELYPKKIILSLDTYENKIAIQGWKTKSNIELLDFVAKISEPTQLAGILHTDIAKDGMMSGVNLDSTEKLAKAVNCPVIASGGISSLEDVQDLSRLQCPNIHGVIIGRALYENKINLKEAIDYLEKNHVM